MPLRNLGKVIRERQSSRCFYFALERVIRLDISPDIHPVQSKLLARTNRQCESTLSSLDAGTAYSTETGHYGVAQVIFIDQKMRSLIYLVARRAPTLRTGVAGLRDRTSGQAICKGQEQTLVQREVPRNRIDRQVLMG